MRALVRRFFICLTAVLGLWSFGDPAQADTIDGAIYFGGGTTNFYDPANGLVPAGSDNSAGPSITVPGTFFIFGWCQ
jgi:hypothetical protein